MNTRETCLFEMNATLEKYVSSGNTFQIKGSDHDAVLCTDSSTYSIKRVETSNDIYCVAPSCTSTFDVLFKCKDFFELTLIRGRVSKLLDCLKDTKYSGKSFEGGIDRSKLMTREQIENIIEASEKEISSCLLEFNVIEMNGFMRLLDSTTLDETIEVLIQTITINDLSLENISESSILGLLPEYEPVFILYSLSKVGAKKAEAGGDTWEFNWEKICRKTARFVMAKLANQNNNPLIKADEFMNEWEISTPGKGTPNVSFLEGLAIKEDIINNKLSTIYYRYLPVDSLPFDAKSRFEKLFQVRSRYTIEELEPYTKDLFGGVGQPKNHAELLVQCTKIIDKFYYSK